MTQAQKKLKNKLLAAIHTAERYRTLYADDRESWRQLLRSHYGVESSKDLSIDHLIELLEWLKMRKASLEVRLDRASPAQLHKLRQLWEAYARDPSERALLHFVARYQGGAIPIRLEMLTAKAAQSAIVALRKSLGSRR